ncbi:CBS domain-containing protein [Halobellus salinus]|uniref:CBS domain-containing protein n=1 Tax=Halobellus salinus TaxID=931585 RepID=A0A830EI63_9EURY|nr:CBS domain-containing protein [Halobellus salinus]GGJ13987.1 CBS domain-containing protein [Halobellus salinus]SMP31790.1 CBS domain-containing protein [Halobellus salinus]
MNVADAMTPREELVTAELPGTRDDVLEYLQERGFSSVPVVKQTDDGEAYRGLVSRQELIERPDEGQLAVLMREVPTVSADATVEEAARLMVDAGTRRVPVVDGRLDGIITITDVIRTIAREEVVVDTTAGDVATRDVNTTHQETPLPVAEREIYYANVPYTVCLDSEGSMAGILTEVDIINVARVVEGEDDTGDSVASQDDDWMWEGIKAVGKRYIPTRNVEIPAEPASRFMSDDITAVSRTKPAMAVAQTLITEDIEQIPLVAGDELVGIVRDVDLVEAV